MTLLRPFALCLSLALAAWTPATAQSFREVGIKLGATASTIATDLPSENPLVRGGFSGLLFAEWALAGPAALIAEAGYAERGYEVRRAVSIDYFVQPDTPVEDHNAEWRIDKPFRYVSLGVLGKLPVATLGPVSAYALAGPRFNALLCCGGEDVPGYDYRPTAWDLTFGAGTRLECGPLPLLVEVRFNLGLTDALQGQWGGEAYHRAIDLMAGIRL